VEGRDRRGLVRGVVVSSAGGSGTLRSGAGETDLEVHYAKSYRPFELFVNENYKLYCRMKLK